MRFRDILNRLYLIGVILACGFLGFQLVIITANVTMRYLFNTGISWMEEISKDVLMPAFTFLSMAIGVKLDLHINVNIIPKRAPHWVTTALTKMKHAILIVIGSVFFYYGISLIMNIKASIASLPMLPASLQFVCIPLAGLLIVCDSVMSLLGLDKADSYLEDKFMGAGDPSNG